MAELLSARALHRMETSEGVMADVVVVEPNGDETVVHCVCRSEGTEVGGEGEALNYLNNRYGDVVFCTAVRSAALGTLVR